MKNVSVTYFNDGLTVAELRKLIEHWPDVDKDGEPYTVWISTGEGLSSMVKTVSPLNARYYQDVCGGDIYLSDEGLG